MPIAPLVPPYDTDDTQLLALCIWREARGESLQGKLGVLSVIRNRCAMAPAQGFKADTRGNVLKPWAFSSFMEGDPNAVKYPSQSDPSWQDCLALAGGLPTSDPTSGAVFYFSPPLVEPPHAWGTVEHTVDIGNLHFYKIL